MQPQYIQNLKPVLRDIVVSLEEKFPYAQALFTEQEGLSVSLTGTETQAVEISPRRGVTLSVFNGEYTAEVGTSSLNPKDLRDMADRLKERIPLGKKLLQYHPGEYWTGEFYSPFEIDPRTISMKEKIDELRRMYHALDGRSEKIVSVMVRYSERVNRRLYINQRKQLYQELLHTGCIPLVIGSDGKSSKMHRGGDSRQEGFELVTKIFDELDEIVVRMEQLLKAKPITPGIYDVVGGSGLAGVIAHEAFGHGVEADMFTKKRAKAAEFIEKEVAAPLVNMFDNPAFPGLSGSFYFDDEGQPASETQIIKNGVLKRVLTDHRSAVSLNLPRSANGRRESFAKKAYARMTNTYFGTGGSEVEDMIGSIDHGFYMPDGSNGMEDPKNWGIQVESPYAIEIKNGKLTDQLYTPVVITGYVPNLLKSISMVGKKLGFEGVGVCQKGHKEQVTVAIGGPHLKMQARVG